LSLRPTTLTGWPFHEGWLDMNATIVEAPSELNEAVTWDISGLRLIYPRLLATVGADVSANVGRVVSIAGERTVAK
jgi:hypothetical protein